MSCKKTKRNAKAVIVIVHGAQEHYGKYSWLCSQFNKIGYHVIGGDLPAHGSNTKKRGHIRSFDEYIEQVRKWISEAKKYSLPIILFGHSMGGLIIIRTLQEKNLNVCCILLSSPCLGMKSPLKVFDVVSKVLDKTVPAFLFKSAILPEIVTQNKEIIELIHNDSLMLNKVSVHWYSELLKNIDIAHEKVNCFPNIPLLLLQAGDDKLVDKIKVKEWFDKLNTEEKIFKEWEGLYHELFSEYEREDILIFANEFLQKHLNKYKAIN